MTEAEWFSATKPTEMGAAILRRKRASDRVLRLTIAAFWSWQANRLRSKADKESLRAAVTLLERWAETDVEPDTPAPGYAFFALDLRTAFRSTIALSGGWEGRYGQDATARLLWLLREVFGNPFAKPERKKGPHRWSSFAPAWRTETVLALANQIYDSRDFGAMPILADALQDANCDNEDILSHCRDAGPHVRGCWVVDLVLGKE
jgi:hypothetical protein